MKKRIYTIILILAISLLIINIVPSIAKYLTNGEANISMSIGSFVVKLNNEDIVSNYEEDFELTDFVFPGTEYAKANTLAPGVNGYYDFIIDASESEVSVRFDISFTERTDDIEISIGGDDALSLIQIDDYTYAGIISLNDTSRVRNLKVNVNWNNNNANNSTDTSLKGSSVTVPFNLKAKQYLGEGINGQANNYYLSIAKPIIIMDVGDTSTSYVSTISSNAQVKDGFSGTTYSYPVSYTIPSSINTSVAGSYDISYSYTMSSTPITATSKLIYVKPQNIDFNYCNYGTKNATISCSKGILTTKSTTESPHIYIPFKEENYINPLKYRYVAIRYKVNDSKTHTFSINMDSNPKNNDYVISKTSITNDGRYHELVFDLWSNNLVKNKDYINGITLDFTNNSDTTMQIDYVKFLKTTDEIEYVYFYDFNNEAGTTLAGKTNVNYTISDGILNLTSTTRDPMIYFQLDDTKSYDPTEYNCIYVKYRLASGVKTTMEFFMVRQPKNQTYAISNSITGNGSWQITILDVSRNSNIMKLSKIDGWRFDPIAITSTQLEVDYIGISNRCMN